MCELHGIPCAGNCLDPDILLISVNAGYIHANGGLRWLMANLQELEPRAGLLEGTRRLGVEALARAAAGLQPAIIGVSVAIWNHAESRELLALLRGLLPAVVLVVGGPEASYLPADHALFEHVDVLIRGEAETAFAQLCRERLAVGAGVAGGEVAAGDGGARDGGAGVGRGLHIIDAGRGGLDRLILPYDRLQDGDLAHRLLYIETSRGCPFRCEFCLSSVQGKVREFPLEPVLQQVRRLYERGGRFFKVIDRTFNLDIQRAERTLEVFLELLSSGKNPGAYVQFEVVPDRLPLQLRQIISRFPPESLRLEVGIQTFNQEAAARINRRQNQERSLKNLRFLLQETHAVIHADLIIGLPGEDVESFAKGFDRLWQLSPQEIQLGVLKALPGTTLHRHDEQWGMQYNPEAPYEILQTAHIPRQQMDALKLAAKYWELIVNRGRYPQLVEQLFPKQPGSFMKLLELSTWLYSRLGRSWGIDANTMRNLLIEYSS